MIWADAARSIAYTLRDTLPLQQSYFSAWRILADMSGTPLESIVPWNAKQEIPARYHSSVDDIVARLHAREPIEYIVGTTSFYSLDLFINEAVLIPRPETEVLVESIVRWYQGHRIAPRTILDLGTGSGCIALALAQSFRDSMVTGVDRSLDALSLVRRNISEHGLIHRVSCMASDWWDGLSKTKIWDMVVSNPPYIRRADLRDLPRSVRDYEPGIALDGGVDGLEAMRRIIAGAEQGLRPGGLLALECGWNQHYEVLTIIRETNAFESGTIRNDLGGVPRIILARRKER